MTDIQWDSEASLMRVITFSTAEPQEELVGRGIVRELVGAFLEMEPAAQDGLMIRAAGTDWIQEYDADAIRELAARPEYSGGHGAFDTADLADDPEADEEIDVLVSESGSSDGTAGRFGDAEHGTA